MHHEEMPQCDKKQRAKDGQEKRLQSSPKSCPKKNSSTLFIGDDYRMVITTLSLLKERDGEMGTFNHRRVTSPDERNVGQYTYREMTLSFYTLKGLCMQVASQNTPVARRRALNLYLVLGCTGVGGNLSRRLFDWRVSLWRGGLGSDGTPFCEFRSAGIVAAARSGGSGRAPVRED